MRSSVGLLTAGLEPKSGRELEHALIERYLSDWHFAHPEQGCPFAAAGSELVRLTPAARAHVLAEATHFIERLAAALGGARGREVLALVAQGLKQQGGSNAIVRAATSRVSKHWVI